MRIMDYIPGQQVQAQRTERDQNSSVRTSQSSFDEYLSQAEAARDDRFDRQDRVEAADEYDDSWADEANQTGKNDSVKADEVSKPEDMKKPQEVPQKDEEGEHDYGQDDSEQNITGTENQDSKTVDESKVSNSDDKAAKANTLNKTPDVSSEADKETVLAQMAALLGINADQLKDILAKLNLTPADLADSKNALSVIQAAAGAENPVELLWKPGVVQTLQTLTQMADDFAGSLNNLEQAAVKHAPAAADAPEQTALNGQPAETAAVESSAENGQVRNEALNQAQNQAQNQDHSQSEAKETKNEAQAKASDKAVSGLTNQQTAQVQETQSETSAVTSQVPQTAVQTSVILGEESPANGLPPQEDGQGIPLVQDPNANVSGNVTEVKAETVKPRVMTDPMEVIKQVSEQIKVEVRYDSTEMRLTLKPESLGEVSLRIITQNGIVTAQFYAENQRVKEIIESQFDQLRNSLQEKGVEVAEMTAFVGRDDAGDSGSNPGAENSFGEFNQYGPGGRYYGRGVSQAGEAGQILAGLSPSGTDTDVSGNLLEVNIRA